MVERRVGRHADVSCREGVVLELGADVRGVADVPARAAPGLEDLNREVVALVLAEVRDGLAVVILPVVGDLGDEHGVLER